MNGEPELVLHHYEASPYSEKVRAALGYKGLAWRSVLVPPVLPKPELLSLTGGYRRAPVLQIGADVYCDSTLILAELDRRFPDPPFATGALASTAALMGRLVDVDLFWRFTRYLMGLRADAIPEPLLRDRVAMHPQMDFDRAKLAADVPHLAAQLRTVLLEIDGALAGRAFLGGERPAAGDFALYHPLWFLRAVRGLDVLAPSADHVRAWMARIAAFGHGRPTPSTAAEALAVALSSTPAPRLDATDDAPRPLGGLVRVMPEGYPREAVVGRLRHEDARTIVIARGSDAAGLLHIHFPRFGYTVLGIDTESLLASKAETSP